MSRTPADIRYAFEDNRMSNRWIIRALPTEPADQGVALYWSNEHGWNPVVAEVFTDEERDDFDLPLGGEWCLTGPPPAPAPDLQGNPF